MSLAIQSSESLIFCCLFCCFMSFCVCKVTKRSSVLLFSRFSLYFFHHKHFYSFIWGVKQPSLQFLEVWQEATFPCIPAWGDVLSQRLLCAALKSGWPVEISISPLIIVFSSVPFNMVHQCSWSFTWGTLKSCSGPVCISFKADLQAWPKECHRQRADLREKHCK